MLREAQQNCPYFVTANEVCETRRHFVQIFMFPAYRDNGGEGGIRTLGRDKPTHAFQACAFNRSATSPDNYLLSVVSPRIMRVVEERVGFEPTVPFKEDN